MRSGTVNSERREWGSENSDRKMKREVFQISGLKEKTRPGLELERRESLLQVVCQALIGLCLGNVLRGPFIETAIYSWRCMSERCVLEKALQCSLLLLQLLRTNTDFFR